MATLLVSMVRASMGVDEVRDLQDVIGKGFTGMTRVAVSSSEMWRDIVVLNRRHISSMLEVCVRELSSLKEIVDLAGETGRYFPLFRGYEKIQGGTGLRQLWKRL